MNNRRSLLFIFLFAAVILAVALLLANMNRLFPAAGPASLPKQADELHLYALDTGDSDALLLLSPEGDAMLVDTGLMETYPKLRNFLQQKGISAIDTLVLTHPHADHIGGAAKLLSDFTVETVYQIETDYTSKPLDNLTSALKKLDITLLEAKAGARFSLGSLEIEFLAPLHSDYKDLNDCSAVLRFTHGDNVFLLMGDAQADAEEDLVAAYGDALRADFIKAGHHGAKDASRKKFLQVVRPAYAVMTGDHATDPDHVHPSTLRRYTELGAAVYRTDLHGDIAVVSDGGSLRIVTAK